MTLRINQQLKVICPTSSAAHEAARRDDDMNGNAAMSAPALFVNGLDQEDVGLIGDAMPGFVALDVLPTNVFAAHPPILTLRARARLGGQVRQPPSVRKPPEYTANPRRLLSRVSRRTALDRSTERRDRESS